MRYSSGWQLRCTIVLAMGILGGNSGARADSVFALNGFGERQIAVDARSAALGGAGIALGDGRSLSAINPATARSEELTFMGLAVAPELLRTSFEDETMTRVGFDLPLVRASFRLPIGATLSLGLHGETSFNAPPMQTFVSQVEDADTLDYFRTLHSDGGITAASVGLAQDLGRLTLGLRFDYLFGSAQEVWTVDFDTDTLFFDSSGRVIAIRDQVDFIDTQLSGAQVSIGACFRPLSALTLGAYATVVPEASGEEVLEGVTSGARVINPRTYNLPSRFGAGLAWRPSSRLLWVSDFEMTPWSNFRVDGKADPALRDVYRFAGGAEWFLGGADSVFETHFPIRVGYSESPQPYRLGAGDGPWQDISERRFTLGTGLPLAENRGWLDVSFQLITRSGAGIDEQDLMLGVSVTAFERWARKL